MKPSKAVLRFLTAIAISALPLHAATINLDLTSTNTGNITLDAGSNDFSFTGLSVDYLIVGGGGGGGTSRNSNTRGGGGGGAGGLLTGNTSISGVQSISVGAGGAGGVPGPVGTWQPATNGADSTAFSLTAIGGGRGGANVTGQDSGASGGSGGGASSSLNNTGGGAGTVGQGNNGAGGNGGGIGGGGGGAGGAASGQTAGAGAASSITGASLTYAQGGAGGNASAGNYDSGTPDPAASNTGNGGKGVAFDTVNGGGGQAGGSGIVVVRYTGDNLLTGGIVSTVGGDTVHQFTTTGANTMGFNATIAGDIDGTGDLDWNGQGTLTLTGNNIYTGTTTVSAGSLLVQGTIARTADLLFSGGNLNLGSTGSIFVLASNYSMGDADDDILAGLISGADTLQVSSFNDGFNDFTQISVIPEPTTALLGGLGMLFLLRRRRA